ncbi:hypothetical protein EON82_23600 [bacterium]|nr:MAG: hypothetical protein EON82_23600 [bacterium]
MWEIQEVRHKEGDAPADSTEDVVTLMTIHKAKGLEFPVVVLPDTTAGFRGAPRDILVDPRKHLVTVKPGKIPPLAHRFVEEERARRDHDEGLRLLYVALTRAQKRLCVCLYPPNPRISMNTVLNQRLRDDVLPGVVVRDGMAKPVPV